MTYIVPEVEIQRIKKELGGKETYSFEFIQLDQISSDENDYVLVGEAGIGKTSILYWIGYQIASGKINSEFIPLFVQLKDMATFKTRNELNSFLETEYELNNYDLNSRFLFLLDGLDQVAKFGNVVDKLNKKNIFGRENKIILTTRPTGYEWIKSTNDHQNSYKYIKIIPFSDGRIKKYMGNQYDNDQFQELFNNDKELISIPILLKLIKELLSENKLFQIQNRTDLYDEFIKYLFEKREKRRKGTTKRSIDASKIKKNLPDISYKALEDMFIGFVPYENAEEYIENVDDLEILINWSVTQNLVEEKECEIFSYTHQSFQEYFASKKLEKMVENTESTKELNEIIMEKMEYNYWDDVWLFMVGGLHKGRSKEVIEIIDKYDPHFAVSCIKEYKGNKKDFKEIINRYLNELHHRSNLRGIAAEAIGEIGSKDNVEDLKPLLKNKDWKVRRNVIDAIKKIGSEDNVKDLMPFLMGDTNEAVRVCAAEAIGKLCSVSDLIDLLKIDYWILRSSVVKAIGLIGNEDNVEDLKHLLTDDNEIVQRYAVEAIKRIGSEDNVKDLVPYVKIDSEDNVKDLVPYVKIDSEENIQDLIILLKDKDEQVRANAVKSIGRIGTKDNVKDLTPLLEDEDDMVRFNAVEAIDKIGSKESIDDLIPLLKDHETHVQDRAIEAIGRIGSEENVNDLLDVLKEYVGEIGFTNFNLLREPDEDFHAPEIVTSSIVEIAIRLDSVKQDKIIKDILESNLIPEYPNEIIGEIKRATGRRFLRTIGKFSS